MQLISVLCCSDQLKCVHYPTTLREWHLPYRQSSRSYGRMMIQLCSKKLSLSSANFFLCRQRRLSACFLLNLLCQYWCGLAIPILMHPFRECLDISLGLRSSEWKIFPCFACVKRLCACLQSEMEGATETCPTAGESAPVRLCCRAGVAQQDV